MVWFLLPPVWTSRPQQWKLLFLSFLIDEKTKNVFIQKSDSKLSTPLNENILSQKVTILNHTKTFYAYD